MIDTDADGIPDGRDACPGQAEDKDGFEDTDGCPDLDNDHDRILDAADKCPNEPETYNGLDDDDGCPDYAPTYLTSGPVQVVTIPFARGSAVIQGPSLPIVDALAVAINGTRETFIKHPCWVVQVHGHASVDERRPDALARARAEAVRAALISRGVPSEEMNVRSFGTARPGCIQATEFCRAYNRRVEASRSGSPTCE